VRNSSKPLGKSMSKEGIGDTLLGLSKNRIETLTDNVFAFAMTLLVLTIHVPTLSPTLASTELPYKIFSLWPKVLTYMVSFLILGVGWVGHHNLFHYIKRSDRLFLWINIAFLMGTAFVPFSTSLFGTYPDTQAALLVFGINTIANGALLLLSWMYATHNRRLVEKDLPQSVVRLVTKRILSLMILFAMSMGLSYVNTKITICLYVLIPLAYIFPGGIDRYFFPAHSTSES